MKKIFNFIKTNFKKIHSILSNNETILFLLVFGFFFCVFTFIYMRMNTLVSSDDHYFHFRFAEKMLSEGFFDSFRNFKSIYFSNVANGGYFIYYNFLFYLVLLPFTFITPLFLAIKLYAVAIISLIGALVYFFIKKIDIRYPFLWAVGFFALIGSGSIWRMFLSRPYVFAPIFLLMLILAIYKRKYFWVFILSFFYLFWHTATFFLPLLIGIIYFTADYLYQRKYDWKLLLSIILGSVFSIIVVSLISTGFFDNIYYNVLDLLKGIISGNKINIPEGGELYPKNLFDFLNQNIILFTMFLSSVIFYVFSYFSERKILLSIDNALKQKRALALSLFFLSLIFFVAISEISNRFADFFVLFAWIFVILIFSELFINLEFTKVILKKAAKYVAFICLAYLFSNSLLQINESFAGGSRPETFSEVGTYLAKNLKKDEIVFNVSWNWFPQLYYYAPEQDYVIGLEPKLTYVYDPKIYWLWANIGNGSVCEKEECPEEKELQGKILKDKKLALTFLKDQGDKIAKIVVNDFKSHYIVSSNSYKSLNNILNNSKHFEKVLNSQNFYYIYKILD